MDLVVDNSEGLLLSLDSHKSVPSPFLTKTYQLVDDPNTNHIVSWGQNDITFVVWRPPEFARDVLSNYFKHNNFSSFVRQLNTYLPIWCDSPPLTPPTSEGCNYNNSVTSALSEDNERLMRSNNVLLSELTHMKKLYNDIIYFVENHVKPVSPNNNTYYPSAPIMMQRQMNKQEIGGENGVTMLNRSYRCGASGLFPHEEDSSSFESKTWVSPYQLVHEGGTGLEEREDGGGVNARLFPRLGLEEEFVRDPCREKVSCFDDTSLYGPHMDLNRNEGDHVKESCIYGCSTDGVSCQLGEVELNPMHVKGVEVQREQRELLPMHAYVLTMPSLSGQLLSGQAGPLSSLLEQLDLAS
ncbi:unnamed protein product [Lupinus luteus]|uniref:HSF-type DNA-binding domain-containing protein n=1 Tax=Lupinus luteus TaxID=3873 RepID=A0AAV1YFA3_LUPLU